MQITITYKEIEEVIKNYINYKCGIPTDKLKVAMINEMKCKDRNVTAIVEILDEK